MDNIQKGNSPNVVVKMWLEFELSHYELTKKHVSHYTMGSPLSPKYF